MEELFRSMKFTEKDMIKLSQVKKDIFIKYRRSYKYNRWNRWDFKEAKRLYREKKIITIRLLDCTSNFILRIACSEGDIELVNYAISKGADDWNEGCEEACRKGHKEIAELMLSKGANRIICGLYIGCYKGHREIIELMFSILKKNSIDHVKYYLNDVFYWACQGAKRNAEQYDIVERIVSLLVKEDWFNLNSALACACRDNCENLVKIMIGGGATYCNYCNKNSFEHCL